ncbi:MAG TPA: M48 family metalloprotease [Pyrinomonadaceae bacterium]
MKRLTLASLLLALLSPFIFAQQQERDMKKEEAIWKDLQAVAPKQVETFKAATVAMDNQKYDEAAKLYEAVMLNAPEFDPVIRRLGICTALAGKVDEGLGLLEHAVSKKRSPENLISLAQVLAYPSETKQGTFEQKVRALKLATEATNNPSIGNDPSYPALMGQLAIDLDQIDPLRVATNKLVSEHPELMVTHYYSALLAAADEEWITAEREILQAEKLGLPHEATQAFLDSGVGSRARVWHYTYYSLGVVAVWVLGLLFLFLTGKLMSRVTLRSIETEDPNKPTTRSQMTLRQWYRRLINVAGFYYALSMPVVMFLVIAVAASITYGFIMLGRIPIKLVLLLGIGALITIYKMIRSLFSKIEKEDPGRALNVDEAPRLWDLTRNVASTVQTRAIDEIRVTPGTELAVYEKGTFRERSNDKAKRILILGVGCLNGFRLNSFRAVLAHEYGHFTNRDTAGGDVAMRVNDHMMKFAQAMYEGGQAVWWNIAFQFLRVYHFIFRRLSHGATRLQEVLADRVAAMKYGASAFEDGLTHVVNRTAQFNAIATQEINSSLTARRVMQNLYELPAIENADVAEATREALNRETSEDDTHPSPNDRFRFTRRITSQTEPALSGMVWDLFTNREALTSEMTKMVQGNLGG